MRENESDGFITVKIWSIAERRYRQEIPVKPGVVERLQARRGFAGRTLMNATKMPSLNRRRDRPSGRSPRLTELGLRSRPDWLSLVQERVDAFLEVRAHIAHLDEVRVALLGAAGFHQAARHLLGRADGQRRIRCDLARDLLHR